MADFYSDSNYGTSGSDRFFGNNAGNWFDANDGSDQLRGYGGIDWLFGDNGDDTIWGGHGNDYLYGDSAHNTRATGNDSIFGGRGDDSIFGQKGDDRLYGQWDDDRIFGGDGNDYISGGSGNDWIDGGWGLDEMNGGSGVDTLDVRFWNGSYELNMTTGVTNFVGETAINFENVYTGSGNDTITGTSGKNVISTSDGDDIIRAGAGNDEIDAGGGDDRLLGVASRKDADVDILTGGRGNDSFFVGDYHGNFYKNAGNGDYALIKDFTSDDRIILDNGSYRLADSPISGVSGTAIYEGGELLAILQGVGSFGLTFNDNGFTTSLESRTFAII